MFKSEYCPFLNSYIAAGSKGCLRAVTTTAWIVIAAVWDVLSIKWASMSLYGLPQLLHRHNIFSFYSIISNLFNFLALLENLSNLIPPLGKSITPIQKICFNILHGSESGDTVLNNNLCVSEGENNLALFFSFACAQNK